jgi:hypothetical protein
VPSTPVTPTSAALAASSGSTSTSPTVSSNENSYLYRCCLTLSCAGIFRHETIFVLIFIVIIYFRSYLNLLTSDAIELSDDDEESGDLQTAIQNSLTQKLSVFLLFSTVVQDKY